MHNFQSFLKWVYETITYIGEGVLLAAGVLFVVILVELWYQAREKSKK